MMAYSNSYVCSVISNEKHLREIRKDNKRTCILPFGTEYKLRLKNKKGTRCMVEVSIDGTDVLFGSRLILNPYQSLDLERFLDQNDKGAKFKFMSLDQAASTGELNDPDSPENGRIQVRFYEEVIQNWTFTTHTTLTPQSFGGGGILRGTSFKHSSIPFVGYCNTGGAVGVNSGGATNLNATSSGAGVTGAASAKGMSSGVGATMDCFMPQEAGGNISVSNNASGVVAENSAGVTGQGGESHQAFSYGAWFQTVAVPVTLDIWLSGPIKVEAKPQLPRYTVKREGDSFRIFENGNPIQFQSFEINERGLTLQLSQGLIETKNFEFAG